MESIHLAHPSDIAAQQKYIKKLEEDIEQYKEKLQVAFLINDGLQGDLEQIKQQTNYYLFYRQFNDDSMLKKKLNLIYDENEISQHQITQIKQKEKIIIKIQEEKQILQQKVDDLQIQIQSLTTLQTAATITKSKTVKQAQSPNSRSGFNQIFKQHFEQSTQENHITTTTPSISKVHAIKQSSFQNQRSGVTQLSVQHLDQSNPKKNQTSQQIPSIPISSKRLATNQSNSPSQRDEVVQFSKQHIDQVVKEKNSIIHNLHLQNQALQQEMEQLKNQILQQTEQQKKETNQLKRNSAIKSQSSGFKDSNGKQDAVKRDDQLQLENEQQKQLHQLIQEQQAKIASYLKLIENQKDQIIEFQNLHNQIKRNSTIHTAGQRQANNKQDLALHLENDQLKKQIQELQAQVTNQKQVMDDQMNRLIEFERLQKQLKRNSLINLQITGKRETSPIENLINEQEKTQPNQEQEQLKAQSQQIQELEAKIQNQIKILDIQKNQIKELQTLPKQNKRTSIINQQISSPKQLAQKQEFVQDSKQLINLQQEGLKQTNSTLQIQELQAQGANYLKIIDNQKKQIAELSELLSNQQKKNNCTKPQNSRDNSGNSNLLQEVKQLKLQLSQNAALGKKSSFWDLKIMSPDNSLLSLVRQNWVFDVLNADNETFEYISQVSILGIDKKTLNQFNEVAFQFNPQLQFSSYSNDSSYIKIRESQNKTLKNQNNPNYLLFSCLIDWKLQQYYGVDSNSSIKKTQLNDFWIKFCLQSDGLIIVPIIKLDIDEIQFIEYLCSLPDYQSTIFIAFMRVPTKWENNWINYLEKTWKIKQFEINEDTSFLGKRGLFFLRENSQISQFIEHLINVEQQKKKIESNFVDVLRTYMQTISSFYFDVKEIIPEFDINFNDNSFDLKMEFKNIQKVKLRKISNLSLYHYIIMHENEEKSEIIQNYQLPPGQSVKNVIVKLVDSRLYLKIYFEEGGYFLKYRFQTLVLQKCWNKPFKIESEVNKFQIIFRI